MHSVARQKPCCIFSQVHKCRRRVGGIAVRCVPSPSGIIIRDDGNHASRSHALRSGGSRSGSGGSPHFLFSPQFFHRLLIIATDGRHNVPLALGGPPPQNFLARTATGAARYKPQLTIVSAIDVRCAAKGRTSKRFL